MTDPDMPGIAAVVKGAYHFLGDRQGFTKHQLDRLLSERCSEAWIREHYGRGSTFVAKREGAVAGVVVVRDDTLEELFVDPNVHRRGIGTALFKTAEAFIFRSGHSTLHVGTTGFAVPFYEAMGARVIGSEACMSGPLSGWPITQLKKVLAMEYREMAPEEIRRIGEVNREEWIEGHYVTRGDGTGFGLKTELVPFEPPKHRPPWSPRGVEARIQDWKPHLDRGGVLYGAFEEKRLIAFVLLGPRRADGSAEIVALFVDKDHRRKGIGASLMTWAEAKAIERDIRALVAYSNPTASAANFYLKWGFQIAGLVSKAIVKALHGDIVMVKALGRN
ncbi:MAG: GNAT family N-acetyltransferase [Planctomycetota bacterium]|jgi:GNAT superfamily N-acetyltransferase